MPRQPAGRYGASRFLDYVVWQDTEPLLAWKWRHKEPEYLTMYAITRHRAAIKALCWRVRFSRRGVSYSKSFYDQTCGGSREAKAQAIAWRDAQLAKIEALTLLDLHTQKRSNNVSGVPGVHFHKTDRQPLGFWQAKIRLRDGRIKAKAFSVRLYGFDEAFRLAVASRSELLAQVENRSFLHHPVAKRLSRQG